MEVIIDRVRGNAASFHARELPTEPGRYLWWFDVESPALVLGSTQSDAVVDHNRCGELGIDIVRRRSGGGAVMLWPGEVLWLDVVITRDDPRWDDDVGRAMWWVGDAWVAAITEIAGEISGLDVYRGPLIERDRGRLVCFAGLGPGEVMLGDHKLVGISQRRVRGVARFQCAMYLAWQPDRLLEVLAPGHPFGGHLGDVADWNHLATPDAIVDLRHALDDHLTR